MKRIRNQVLCTALDGCFWHPHWHSVLNNVIEFSSSPLFYGCPMPSLPICSDEKWYLRPALPVSPMSIILTVKPKAPVPFSCSSNVASLAAASAGSGRLPRFQGAFSFSARFSLKEGKYIHTMSHRIPNADKISPPSFISGNRTPAWQLLLPSHL